MDKEETENPPPLRSVRLKTAFDVQRALARVFNDVRRGELEVQTARTLTYILSVYVKVLEIAALDRLDALEKGMRENGKAFNLASLVSDTFGKPKP